MPREIARLHVVCDKGPAKVKGFRSGPVVAIDGHFADFVVDGTVLDGSGIDVDACFTIWFVFHMNKTMLLLFAKRILRTVRK